MILEYMVCSHIWELLSFFQLRPLHSYPLMSRWRSAAVHHTRLSGLVQSSDIGIHFGAVCYYELFRPRSERPSQSSQRPLSIADIAHCLLQAGPRIRKTRTVQEALSNRAWVRDITGALTVQVILESRLPSCLGQSVAQVTGRQCCWQSGLQINAYKAFFLGQQTIPGAKILAKTRREV